MSGKGRRIFSDDDCQQITHDVSTYIYDKYPVDYIGTTARKWFVAKETIKHVIYRMGAYRNVHGAPLCRHKSCGVTVDIRDKMCERHH